MFRKKRKHKKIRLKLFNLIQKNNYKSHKAKLKTNLLYFSLISHN
jgi:hypothetical protein